MHRVSYQCALFHFTPMSKVSGKSDWKRFKQLWNLLKTMIPEQFKMCCSDFKIICLILHAILHLRFDFSYFQDIENRSQKVNTPKVLMFYNERSDSLQWNTIKLPLRNPHDICSSIRLKHKNSTGTACIPAPISWFPLLESIPNFNQIPKPFGLEKSSQKQLER